MVIGPAVLSGNNDGRDTLASRVCVCVLARRYESCVCVCACIKWNDLEGRWCSCMRF